MLLLVFLTSVIFYCVQKKGNRKILLAHVVITALLLLFFYFSRFFISNSTNQFMPRRYYNFSDWESSEQLGGLNNYLSIAVLIFIVLQLLFIVYTIVLLLARKGKVA